MALKVYGDLTITASTLRDGTSRSGKLITIDTGPKFRKTDLDTLVEDYTAVTCLANPVGISFLSIASAIIVSSTSASIDLIELSGGYRQNYTTNAVAASTVGLGKGQQVAGDPITKIAYSVADNIAGKVQKFNGNTFTISTHTSLTGVTGKITTLINIASGSWIVGTDDGKIHELDTTPSVVKTITLPTTPAAGTAPTWKVSGLSYFNDRLMVLTAAGVVFIYTYSTSTVIKKDYFGSVGSGGNALLGTTLCDSASGAVLYSPNFNKTTTGSEVLEYDLVSMTTEDIHRVELAQKSCPAVGIDKSTYRAWAIIDTNKIRVFDISNRDNTTVTTRVQDPAGTDIAARIIRLRDAGPGRATVDLDQNITAVETSLNARKNSKYIEITIEDLATDKFDVRVFST